MSVNVSTYESSLQTKLNATTGSTSTTDFLLLAKAMDALNTGSVITAATTGALPSASANAGRTYFVTADSLLYYSNGTSWVSVPTTTSLIAAITGSAPATLDTLQELAAALGNDANYATTVTNALAAKAPLASPTFTGTVSGITKTMVGLGNVDNTSDASKPVSTAQQTALDLKAPLASPSFTGWTGVVGFRETKVAVAASAIDLATGSYFSKTISGATTFTVSNVPSTGNVGAFVLDLTNGGSASITWMTGTKWASGTAPTLTSSGRDVLGFFTHDGGTTWNGFVLGKALA